MKRKVTLILSTFCLAYVVAFATWLHWPPPAPDPTLVEPRLIALREPFRSVQSFYYMDGGTIGIRIIDANGHTEEFTSPSHLGSDESHQRIFIGGIYDRHSWTAEVDHPNETRAALVRILWRYRRPVDRRRDAQLDENIADLSKRTSDFLRFVAHSYAGDYRYPY
jgi:hypothetical protein